VPTPCCGGSASRASGLIPDDFRRAHPGLECPGRPQRSAHRALLQSARTPSAQAGATGVRRNVTATEGELGLLCPATLRARPTQASLRPVTSRARPRPRSSRSLTPGTRSAHQRLRGACRPPRASRDAAGSVVNRVHQARRSFPGPYRPLNLASTPGSIQRGARRTSRAARPDLDQESCTSERSSRATRPCAQTSAR
jgi:hypothetical protein